MDSFNFIRALYYTFSHVFQQLYETDLRETHTSLDIPIYILHGRHDLNAPSYLVDDYYELLEAPEKELIYFEHSGHNPWITEPVLFQQTVLDLLNQD
ncbi:MAG: alpha/beta fold hydrolase [Candidatus Izemoplasmataceae bacterium]